MRQAYEALRRNARLAVMAAAFNAAAVVLALEFARADGAHVSGSTLAASAVGAVLVTVGVFAGAALGVARIRRGRRNEPRS